MITLIDPSLIIRIGLIVGTSLQTDVDILIAATVFRIGGSRSSRGAGIDLTDRLEAVCSDIDPVVRGIAVGAFLVVQIQLEIRLQGRRTVILIVVRLVLDIDLAFIRTRDAVAVGRDQVERDAVTTVGRIGNDDISGCRIGRDCRKKNKTL
uniref:hypothetical protein n=1 Tax=Alistipes megaguti TaxID=2364787 RepID=UPI000EFB8D10|nr:hypothetical protein [Alistipes megaguti]